MQKTLTLSSQGQIVIPARIRKELGLKPGSKLTLTVDKAGSEPKAILEPQPDSWTEYVMGIGEGIWGKGEEYIKKQRESW